MGVNCSSQELLVGEWLQTSRGISLHQSLQLGQEQLDLVPEGIRLRVLGYVLIHELLVGLDEGRDFVTESGLFGAEAGQGVLPMHQHQLRCRGGGNTRE